MSSPNCPNKNKAIASFITNASDPATASWDLSPYRSAGMAEPGVNVGLLLNNRELWHPASNDIFDRILKPYSQDGSWQFVPSIVSSIVATVFGGAGGMIWISTPFFGKMTLLEHLGRVFLGFVFCGIGFFIYLYSHEKVIFSNHHRAFFKTRKSLKSTDVTQLKSFVYFKEILALQLLEKVVASGGKCNGGKTEAKKTYELNIIKNNKSREHVICNSDYDYLKKVIAELSAFTGIPNIEFSRQD